MAGITGKDAVLTEYAKKLETLDAPKGRSLTQDATRRMLKNTAAVSRQTLRPGTLPVPTRMAAICSRASCRARR
jgi:hypothetical protein